MFFALKLCIFLQEFFPLNSQFNVLSGNPILLITDMLVNVGIALRESRPLMTLHFWKKSHSGFVNVYEISPFQYLSNAFT